MAITLREIAAVAADAGYASELVMLGGNVKGVAIRKQGDASELSGVVVTLDGGAESGEWGTSEVEFCNMDPGEDTDTAPGFRTALHGPWDVVAYAKNFGETYGTL